MICIHTTFCVHVSETNNRPTCRQDALRKLPPQRLSQQERRKCVGAIVRERILRIDFTNRTRVISTRTMNDHIKRFACKCCSQCNDRNWIVKIGGTKFDLCIGMTCIMRRLANDFARRLCNRINFSDSKHHVVTSTSKFARSRTTDAHCGTCDKSSSAARRILIGFH